MQCDIKKYKFHAIEIIYFNLIISCDDIKINSVKIEAIINWKNLQNVYNVWLFFRFVNFYKWFIWYFLKIVWFFVNLTKKIMKFLWDIMYECMFNNLKKQFMMILILVYFDSDLKCVLKADLSDHAQKNVLSQYDKNDMLYSVVFFSWKLNAAESNYEIYNKKLLIIIQCFKQWCSEFKRLIFSVKILINYKNLQYFMIMK